MTIEIHHAPRLPRTPDPVIRLPRPVIDLCPTCCGRGHLGTHPARIAWEARKVLLDDLVRDLFREYIADRATPEEYMTAQDLQAIHEDKEAGLPDVMPCTACTVRP